MIASEPSADPTGARRPELRWPFQIEEKAFQSLHQSVIGWGEPLGRGITLGEGSVPYGGMGVTALKENPEVSTHSMTSTSHPPTQLPQVMAAFWVPSLLSQGHHQAPPARAF